MSTDSAASVSSSASSLWDRITTWASENKAIVYTIAGTAVVITGAGAVYYFSDSRRDTSTTSPEKKKSKKERRNEKKKAEEESKSGITLKDEEAGMHRPDTFCVPLTHALTAVPTPKAPTVEPEEELPQIDETTIDSYAQEVRILDASIFLFGARTDIEQERKTFAAKLKAAGNKAYGSKDYNKAIELYGKAILCKPDPVYYSNRAACYNVLSDWDKVVEDTSAAIAMDSEYVKALNRRAHAYEHLGMFSEALLDYTASCIIDGFKNEQSAQSVERLLKKVAEKKGKAILEKKQNKLPSATFVSNYLQSFRARPPPEGLEEKAELDESTGKGQLQRGLTAMSRKTGAGYEEAAQSFRKAVELGDLGDYEALALNMRGTFSYLEGDTAKALEDLTKAVELQPSMTQAWIKRASMHLELGDREAASGDFEKATAQNEKDPDIFYHRAQLHFILGEFAEAAKDYQQSIELDRDFIFSHIQLGVTQYKMGSVASSMATFRRCIKNFDKVPDVYNYYGELLLDQQKYQEAIEKFDTATDIEKQTKPMNMNVLPLINKALALFQWKQDFAEAESLCQKALISKYSPIPVVLSETHTNNSRPGM